MARVKGRDVPAAVRTLEATSAQHTEQIEEHARLLTKLDTDVTQLESDVGQLSASVPELSDDTTTTMESGNKLAELSRLLTHQVGRLAKTLGVMATDHGDRMEQIESRLDRPRRERTHAGYDGRFTAPSRGSGAPRLAR